MNKQKILIIDDEPDMVYAVQMRLEASDYQVVSALDGNEGLEKARKEKPDLIILDVMLP
ncbi:MAG: response regulator, partial [Candidatus Omnitrophica bacterium]|nr:response regulator [Candidatus Omnitrophota bacterium]